MRPRPNRASHRKPVAKYWSFSPEWKGETAFIIAGGSSVADLDLSRLKGRKVIALNSSYQTYPDADFLAFGDHRWWLENRKHLTDFKGRIFTAAPVDHEQVLRLQLDPNQIGLSFNPGRLCLGKTVLRAALGACLHLKVARVVLLGADMCRGPDGRSHHHPPHRWPVKAGCWERQMKQLRTVAAPLRDNGVQVFNASPISLIDWWPKISFEESLTWPTQ